MPRAALGQKGLKNQYFAICHPLGSGRPKRKMEKSCAILGRNFWGGRIFSPNVPLAPGNCVFLFLARNFSKCQGAAALGQKGPETPYFAISRPWGPDRPKRKMQKRCEISGRNFLGRPDFFPKSAPSYGKLRFSVFGPGPEFL